MWLYHRYKVRLFLWIIDSNSNLLLLYYLICNNHEKHAHLHRRNQPPEQPETIARFGHSGRLQRPQLAATLPVPPRSQQLRSPLRGGN